MAVYAVGDVQGCYDELSRMLDLIHFDPASDQLWLAGDLVNRGPKSLEVLRLAKQLESNCVVVLGNHDLHFLALAAGVDAYQHPMDTLQPILDAPDSHELIHWFRQQKLFHHDADLAFSMVHAGLPPYWTLQQALEYANEVEQVLQSDHWQSFFEHMYGNDPKMWSETLTGWDRLRYITNCFTRLRFCHLDGRLALKFKGAPSENPKPQLAWFEMPERKTAHEDIVFGHWSRLGIGQYGHVFSLDSGVVWGDRLTAIRLDTKPVTWFSVEADPDALPHAKPEFIRAKGTLSGQDESN